MRILAVTNMYPSEAHPGRGVFVREQVKSLSAAGLEPRVLFIDRLRDGPSAYYCMGVQFADAVREFNPHAVHVMYGGVMAAQITRHHHTRPTLVTFHGSDLAGENLSGWVRRIISRYGVWCSRRAAQAAEGIVVVARHLLKALPQPTLTKACILPCGIDPNRFKPMSREKCRRQLGWSNDLFHVLFASSNGDPVKRPWLARSALKKALGRGIPAELHYMAGIPNSLVPVWLNASDVLLLTSLHEGSPTVVKEALACRLPVVSVNVGDVAERIEFIEGCHLAEADPADLAEKLSLVHARGERLACGELADALSVDSVARRLKRIYELMVEGRRVGALSQAIAG